MALSTDRSIPAAYSYSNGSDNRSIAMLAQVLRQFHVDTDPRYQPLEGETYCNIFAWDVSRALACELPHWWRGQEQTANMLERWLMDHGAEYGWLKANASIAQGKACQGYPAIALWANPSGGHGHIAFLMPIAAMDIVLAQAGKRCGYDVGYNEAFGVLPATFWWHL